MKLEHALISLKRERWEFGALLVQIPVKEKKSYSFITSLIIKLSRPLKKKEKKKVITAFISPTQGKCSLDPIYLPSRLLGLTIMENVIQIGHAFLTI